MKSLYVSPAPGVSVVSPGQFIPDYAHKRSKRRELLQEVLERQWVPLTFNIVSLQPLRAFVTITSTCLYVWCLPHYLFNFLSNRSDYRHEHSLSLEYNQFPQPKHTSVSRSTNMTCSPETPQLPVSHIID